MVCTNMWNFRLKFELCDSLYCSAPLARAFCRCCCLTTELLAHSQHCYTLLPQYTQFKSDVITDKSHREIFFVKVMCWIIWKTWAKISWKHRVTKISEWVCLILPSFGVSDFYIFCECSYVICSFRLNFRKSNVLNLKKLEQKSGWKISKISWKHRVTKNSEWLCLILLSFRVSDFYIFCEWSCVICSFRINL